MIIDNMTLEEVGKSLLRTTRENEEYFARLVGYRKKEYRRAVLKRKGKTYFKPIIRIVENIEYYICPYCHGKKEANQGIIWHTVMALFRYQNRIMYCTIDDSNTHVSLYTTHFLERYIERHLKDDSQPGIETLIKFENERNHIVCVMDVKDPIYDNRIIAGTRFGIGCGYKVADNVFMYKTYIDKETIRAGEKLRVQETSESLLAPVGVDNYNREITRLDAVGLSEAV